MQRTKEPKIQISSNFYNLIIKKIKYSFAYLLIGLNVVKLRLLGSLVAYLLIGFFGSWVLSANAQTTPKNTISVTPQIARLDLAADKPETEYLYVNNTQNPVELSFSMQDFKELEENGIPGFLNQQDAKNYKYALSSWVTFDKKDLILNPGEKGTLKVTVDKTRLTQGGHYGSVLAEIKQKDGEKGVKIKAILASLLFVRATTGYEREEGKISFFAPIIDFWEFPDKFLMRFQNTGNVDTIPYGLIEIKDMLGRTVAKGIVNQGSLITLPESIRRYDIPLQRLTGFLPVGFYNAAILVHFGQNNKIATSHMGFFSQGSIDLRLIVGIFIVLFVLIFVARRKLKRK
jgi:hypothetical protein